MAKVWYFGIWFNAVASALNLYAFTQDGNQLGWAALSTLSMEYCYWKWLAELYINGGK